MAEQPASPGKTPQDLKIRVISGAVYGAVFIGALWAGGWVLGGFLAVLWLLAAYEWALLTCGKTPERWFVMWRTLTATGFITVSTGLVVISWIAGMEILVMLAAIAVVAFAMGLIYRWIHWVLVGIAYLGPPALAMLFVLLSPHGAVVVTWLVLVIWTTDVAAYFVGRAVGGRKLAPRISPGKTWSGSIGGAAGAALVGGVVAGFVEPLPVALMVLAGMWVSLWAQVGDLFESWVKRRFGVKDSGTLIPGHGGVLDRIDGLLFGTVAMVPVVVLLAAFPAIG